MEPTLPCLVEKPLLERCESRMPGAYTALLEPHTQLLYKKLAIAPLQYPMEALLSMASIVHEADMIRDATAELLWNEVPQTFEWIGILQAYLLMAQVPSSSNV